MLIARFISHILFVLVCPVDKAERDCEKQCVACGNRGCAQPGHGCVGACYAGYTGLERTNCQERMYFMTLFTMCIYTSFKY